MKTIFKYTISIAHEQRIAMPKGAQILDVQIQNNMPVLWALVDITKPLEEKIIFIIGTGNDATAAESARYICTFQVPSGLVFHVFEWGFYESIR